MLPGFPSRKNRTIRTSCPARGAAAATPRTNPTSVRAERRMATIVSTPEVREELRCVGQAPEGASEVEGGHLRRLEGDPLGGRGELPAGEERPQDVERPERKCLRLRRAPDKGNAPVDRLSISRRESRVEKAGDSRPHGRGVEVLRRDGKIPTSRDENVVRPRAGVRERRAAAGSGNPPKQLDGISVEADPADRRPVPGVARVRRPVDALEDDPRAVGVLDEKHRSDRPEVHRRSRGSRIEADGEVADRRDDAPIDPGAPPDGVDLCVLLDVATAWQIVEKPGRRGERGGEKGRKKPRGGGVERP